MGDAGGDTGAGVFALFTPADGRGVAGRSEPFQDGAALCRLSPEQQAQLTAQIQMHDTAKLDWHGQIWEEITTIRAV